MIKIHFYARGQRTLLLAGALIAGGCALWAQADGPPPDGPPPGGDTQQQQQGPSADRELKHLTRLLVLTQDQQTQVKTILTAQNQQIHTLFEQSGKSDSNQPPSPETMDATRAQVRTIRDASDTQIAVLLDDTQKTKFAAWEQQRQKAEAQQDQNGDMPPPPDGGPPDGGGPGGGGPPGGGPPGE